MAPRGRDRAPIRRTAVAAAVAATVLVAGSCGGDGDVDDPSTPDPEATAPEEATVGLPAGELPSCSSLDPAPPYVVPARFLPAELPDGWTLTEAATLVPVEGEPPSLQRLVVVDDGVVSGEVQVVRGDAASYPEDAREQPVRGDGAARVGTIGASTGLGDEEATGAVSITWSEDGTTWWVQTSGIDEAEALALVERAELGERGLSDPEGRLVEIAHRPTPSVGTTMLAYSVDGLDQPVEVLVEEYGEGGSGIEVTGSEPFLGPKAGLRVTEIDGRLALRGTDREGRARAMTSLAGDGGPAAAMTDVVEDPVAQDTVLTSLEPVEPDDERLADVPVRYDIFTFPSCRPGGG